MATTVFTAGILARALCLFLLTPHLVAFLQAPPRYGGIPPESPLLFPESPGTAPSPLAPASATFVSASKLALRASPPPSRPRRSRHRPVFPSWRRHALPPSTAAQNTPLRPRAGPPHVPSRCRKRPGTPPSARSLPPSHSLPSHHRETMSAPRAAGNGPSSQSIPPA